MPVRKFRLVSFLISDNPILSNMTQICNIRAPRGWYAVMWGKGGGTLNCKSDLGSVQKTFIDTKTHIFLLTFLVQMQGHPLPFSLMPLVPSQGTVIIRIYAVYNSTTVLIICPHT